MTALFTLTIQHLSRRVQYDENQKKKKKALAVLSLKYYIPLISLSFFLFGNHSFLSPTL